VTAPHTAGVRAAPDPGTATPTVRVTGALDDACGAEPIALVLAHLTGSAAPSAVRLGSGGPADIDPLGPAALLMVLRHCAAADPVLRRPAAGAGRG